MIDMRGFIDFNLACRFARKNMMRGRKHLRRFNSHLRNMLITMPFGGSMGIVIEVKDVHFREIVK